MLTATFAVDPAIFVDNRRVPQAAAGAGRGGSGAVTTTPPGVAHPGRRDHLDHQAQCDNG